MKYVLVFMAAVVLMSSPIGDPIQKVVRPVVAKVCHLDADRAGSHSIHVPGILVQTRDGEWRWVEKVKIADTHGTTTK